MMDALRKSYTRPWLRRVSVAVAGLVLLSATAWYCRGTFTHQAKAQPAAPSPVANPTSEGPSDYTSRVVAYVHQNQPITRQDLGEYLIVRHGVEKLPLLLNKRIVDEACQQAGIQVNAAEVEAALAEDLKGLAVDQATFVKTVLGRYRKNLYEWKEDVVRPRLQMTRLVQPRLHVSEDDLRKAYESAHGEKIECRLILFKHDQYKQALEQYATLRSSEAAFAKAAREQHESSLAATGGKIKPIGRYSMEKKVEDQAFMLQPGQLSELIATTQGIMLLKCDRRIPADTTVNFEAARGKLEKEIRDHKVQAEMGLLFQTLREKARPQSLLQKCDRAPTGPTPAPTQVVAYVAGSRPVTREDLGEFLIARYGAEKLEFLVNRRIIDRECVARNIVIDDAEIDKVLEEDLKALTLDRKHFEKDLLAKWGKNLFEWREDVIRPRLMLTRLSQGRARCEEADLKKAFEAYYGERLECRVILWPADQAKFAMQEYPKIRDSEEEFARKAKSQPSPTLAAHGGKIPVFGLHTLGDEALEREAFRLQPGEISALVGTAQGQVVIKCDRRIPPDRTKKLEDVRGALTKEVLEKKVQQEMQLVFKELRDRANPQMILKTTGKPEDLLAETKKLLSDLPPLNATMAPR